MGHLTFDVYDVADDNSITLARSKTYAYVQKQGICNWVSNGNRHIFEACASENTPKKEVVGLCNVLKPSTKKHLTIDQFIGTVVLESLLYSSKCKITLSSSYVEKYASHNFEILKDNFLQPIIAFAVAESAAFYSSYEDNGDVLYAPDIELQQFSGAFTGACVALALFSAKNAAVSIKSAGIVNHFFPFKHEDFIRDTYPLRMQNLLRKSRPSFIHEHLCKIHHMLPEFAIELITTGKKIYQLFFDSIAHINLRALKLEHDDVFPGWYQIKHGLKDASTPADIRASYEPLRKRMLDLRKRTAEFILENAYELGFLASDLRFKPRQCKAHP